MDINDCIVADLQVGDKVYYQPTHYVLEDKWENGIVKEIPDFVNEHGSVGYNCIRVVYNCGGKWDRYKEYTSALTNLRDLNLGWKYEIS